MKQLLLMLALAAGVALAGQLQVGSKVNDFNLTDTQGAPVAFSSLKGDTTVVLFIATKCPISNDYNERMKELYRDYSPKGVKFVFINSNHTEPASEVAEHARSHGFPFRVYKDEGNVVADMFGAQFTPEAYVLDQSGTIRYHGHIDDARKGPINVHGLRNALNEMLAGKPVTTAQTKAFGCTIKRKKAT